MSPFPFPRRSPADPRTRGPSSRTVRPGLAVPPGPGQARNVTASSVAAAPASVGGHDPRPATVAAPLPGPGPQRSGRQLRVACPWFFPADKEAATVRAARTESVCAGPGGHRPPGVRHERQGTVRHLGRTDRRRTRGNAQGRTPRTITTARSPHGRVAVRRVAVRRVAVPRRHMTAADTPAGPPVLLGGGPLAGN